MKKMLVAMLTVVVVLSALSTSAYAGPKIPAEGSWTYDPTLVSERWADGNLFMHGTDTAAWEGTFTGTSTEEYVGVMHSSGAGFYKGTVSFEGTVEGREGTLEILYVGKSPGDFANWAGTWRIIGGGGELENLHGKGTFTNPKMFVIAYSGQIHFHPKKD
jgi:hypothetical protein